MQLTKENIANNIKKFPGIYYIKHKTNNKYYIGQSINVYSRLLCHINKSKIIKHQHIHRAINKDGIENFEFGILAYVIFNDKNTIKNKLDFLEKYYIKKYKCFGQNGYNATIGGDKGVLGLIQSHETKQRIREVNLEKSRQKYIMECWCYNLDSKQYYHLEHIYEIEKIDNRIRKSDVLHYANSETYHNIRRFIFSNTKENLDKKIKFLQNKFNKKFTFKMTDSQIQNLRMSKTKYVYYQYSLDKQLIAKYYLQDLANKYGKLANTLRCKECNEYKQIDNYIWCKKLINEI